MTELKMAQKCKEIARRIIAECLLLIDDHVFYIFRWSGIFMQILKEDRMELLDVII